MENINVDNDNGDVADNNDNDLISNLLGIRDKSIIDKVLQATPDDAAKLLGVKDNQEWEGSIGTRIIFAMVHLRYIKKLHFLRDWLSKKVAVCSFWLTNYWYFVS